MKRLPAPIASMRLWLQSASVLAVVAGYSLLLLLNQRMARLQRAISHEQLVGQLVSDLERTATRQSDLERLSHSVWVPGLRVSLLDPQGAPSAVPIPSQAPRLEGEWMSSPASVRLTDGRRAYLRVEQDVRASLQQEWLAFWLLVAAAGVSSLFTSMLLRLVLQRGLTQPLDAFCRRLQESQTPPRPEDAIDPDTQPRELQPIALAYNDLQERLRASWDRERTFMNGAAHELRTPITLISGRTQSLLRRSDVEPIAPVLKLIRREADQMGVLVHDLLELARRDADQLSLKIGRLAPLDQLLLAYERLLPRAEGRLRIAVGDELDELETLGDADRLQQCLSVLVDNALQYSPASAPVELSCSQRGDGRIAFHVRDHGPGVTAEERERIFSQFVRGSVGLASDRRGSGVGLALVRRLMEAMGGVAQVCEAPGGGADFQLLLPGVSASAPPASP